MPMTKSKPDFNYLISHYPDIKFLAGAVNKWQPQEKTILYTEPVDFAIVFHEISHAILKHDDYSRDIELLRKERDAWKKAQQEARSVGYDIDTDIIEDHLDTYRDWLHSRSTCPNCSTNGVEIEKQIYRCLECNQQWKVNDARNCQLKRRLIK